MYAESFTRYQNLVKPKIAEQGAQGTEIYGGIITNEDYNSKFDDFQQSPKIYDEMILTEPSVSSVKNAVIFPILRAKAQIIPGTDDRKGQEIADMVSSNLLNNDNFTFRDLLEDLLHDALVYGFVLREKIFEVINGMYRWKKFAYRKAHTIWKWNTDENDNLVSVTQQAYNARTGGWDNKPIENMINETKGGVLFHMGYQQKGLNFRGISLLRPAYFAFEAAKFTERKMMIQADRAATGIPHFKFMKGTPTDAQKTEVETVAKNLRTDAEAYLMSVAGVMELEIIGGKEMYGYDLLPNAKHFNEKIAKVALASFLHQQNMGTGSYAMQGSNIEFFLNSVEATANWFEGQFNNGHHGMQHIRQLVKLNYGTLTESKDFKYPKLALSEITGLDIEVIARTVKTFKEVGVKLTAEDIKYLREQAGLPERDIKDIQKDMDAEEERKAEFAKQLSGLNNGKTQKDDTEDDNTEEDPKKEKENAKMFFMQARRGEFVTPELIEFERRILNVAEIDSKLKTVQDELQKETKQFRNFIVTNLVNTGVNILSKKSDIKTIQEKLNKFAVKTLPGRAKLINATIVKSKDIFQFGRVQVKEEIRKLKSGVSMQGEIIEDSIQAIKSIRPTVEITIDNFLNKLKTEFDNEVLAQAKTGIVNDRALIKAMDRVSQNVFNASMGGLAVEAMGLGRGVEHKAQGVQRIVRSEILDDRTCFIAGTKILTKHGNKNIENVEKGDIVWSGKAWQVVTNTMKRLYTDNLYHINNKIICTGNHPIYSNGDWKRADELSFGDIINQERFKFYVGKFINKCIIDSEYFPSSFFKNQISTLVMFFVVPILAIYFKVKFDLWESKVKAIFSNSIFLFKLKLEIFKSKADFPFNSSFKSDSYAFSVTGNGTESPYFGLSRYNPERLFTVRTFYDTCRSSALFRTMFSVNATGKPFAALTTKLLSKSSFLVKITRTINGTKLVSSSIGFWNGKIFKAVRTIFSNISTSTRTIFSLNSRALPKFFTASWTCIRVISLRYSHTLSRTANNFWNFIVRVASFYRNATNEAISINSSHAKIYKNKTIKASKSCYVYNFTVNNDNTYIANGVLVHNCDNCFAIDGKEYDIDSAEFAEVSTGPYNQCLGGHLCRGVNIATEV